MNPTRPARGTVPSPIVGRTITGPRLVVRKRVT